MALTFVPCILNTACRSPNMTDYSRRFSCAPVHQVPSEAFSSSLVHHPCNPRLIFPVISPPARTAASATVHNHASALAPLALAILPITRPYHGAR